MSRETLVEVFNRDLHQKIPISQHMGIEVAAYTGRSITLGAPIGPNENDKGTAFAGCVFSLCTLTGWSLVSLILKEAELDADVVVYDSTIKYLAPLTEDITAQSAVLTTTTVEHFIEAFRQKGRAKTEVPVTITKNGTAAVQFVGKYAALTKHTAIR